MNSRVYILLNIVDGKSEEAVCSLQNKEGVMKVDLLEGSPDLLVMCEAPNRQRLAEELMPVIGCIDGITEDLRLLVTQDNESPCFPIPWSSRHAEKRTEDTNIRIKESVRRPI